MMEGTKPKILAKRMITEARIFKVEDVDLEFKNGAQRTFQRAHPRAERAVLVVPVIDNNTILLIREYSVGVERYELGFPKGMMEVGEDPFVAADREMKEEVGYGAKKFTLLKEMTAIPGYFTGTIHAVLAQDLYPETLEGDEPEPLEVIPWSLDKIDELLARPDFTEGRCIAALYMARDLLRK